MTQATLDRMKPEDWAVVRAIYLEGIATGDATFETDAPAGRFAEGLTRAYLEREDIGAAIMRLAVQNSQLFEDLAGSLLLRALTAADTG